VREDVHDSSAFWGANLSLINLVPCYHQFRVGRMHVEFLGVPRQRAGVSEIEVQADTLGQLLGLLSARIPSFSELITVDRLHSALVANLNGERFISDPQTPLRHDDSVLILSADAGG
jgi:molybdopterin converting factor small subunit